MPQRRATISLIVVALATFALIAALIVLMTRPAWPAEKPSLQPYTCEDVRRLVAEKGKLAAIAFAVEQGLSIRQIYLIRRTCKV
jgi:hypothetical protein